MSQFVLNIFITKLAISKQRLIIWEKKNIQVYRIILWHTLFWCIRQYSFQREKNKTVSIRLTTYRYICVLSGDINPLAIFQVQATMQLRLKLVTFVRAEKTKIIEFYLNEFYLVHLSESDESLGKFGIQILDEFWWRH